MSLTFDRVEFEDFKRATKEFCEALPKCNAEQADNGMKALGLMYLDGRFKGPQLILAQSYLQYAMRRHTEHEMRSLGLGT